MKPQLNTNFEYDEWYSKMREHQIINQFDEGYGYEDVDEEWGVVG